MTALPDPGTARTLLFVPGTKPERVAKALASGADLVVVDLEDAVPAAAKATARQAVDRLLGEGLPLMVRINAVGTADHLADLELVRRHGCPIMLPKAQDVEALDRLALGCGPVVALVETAAGVLAAPSLAAHPAVVRLAFGHLDLAAELGIDPDAHEALLWARSTLVLASAAAGLAAPVDGVTADVTDEERLDGDVHRAQQLGMGGKLCIHPRQVVAATRGFAPDEATVTWARAVLEAAAAAEAAGEGVATLDGRMVDRPVVERALRVLRVVDAAAPRPDLTAESTDEPTGRES
ncbi:HpcH/HpaI aldolase/citrate lyase family protein [Nocardioides houyundeii]|uniref:HpcH/HpaI aldolase/citrate lyase family protein n=1 Tax=Nocardioides houyundeii TaxID=2045452 RepID=UPI000DF3241F|nr:CoA ester lyase [Nocardioides houyundeii]